MFVFVSDLHDLSSASDRPSLPRTGYAKPLTLRTETDLPPKSVNLTEFFVAPQGSADVWFYFS
jgi:hypothetical protein